MSLVCIHSCSSHCVCVVSTVNFGAWVADFGALIFGILLAELILMIKHADACINNNTVNIIHNPMFLCSGVDQM